MPKTTGHPSDAREPQLQATLRSVEALLDARVTQLCDEVSHYPTPIARCDEQLTKLLEQRARALSLLQTVAAVTGRSTSLDPGTLGEAIARLLEGYPLIEDAEEAALVAQLRATTAMDNA